MGEVVEDTKVSFVFTFAGVFALDSRPQTMDGKWMKGIWIQHKE